MFQLPDLPYDHAALEPVISRATMHLHHDKHHKAYVDTLNGLLAKDGWSPPSLEALIGQVRDEAAHRKLFNNAGQAWNHAFFWEAMTPRGQPPQAALAQAITEAFGDLASLKTQFVEAGATHFGSGWVWLAAKADGLVIDTTHDGETLAAREGVTPLLVCDLWEHAYYLDHQNNRKGFLEAWFDALPNWSFASAQLAAAQGSGPAWRYPEPQDDGTGEKRERSV
ncbi:MULTISPECIES: superoxide dismutase [Phenylobacterium]|jgi:Fe-Mn family superoxide dismutase|uniref:Superoxide dismutase n=1 Tax=Phenylobacterium conjunctum TaxID=1298959 RepID=A0ABW3T8D6_9CAUL